MGHYWSQVEAYNTAAEFSSRAEEDAFAQRTFEAAEKALIGVPVRSAKDAVAAVDYLIHAGNGWVLNFSDDRVEGSLIRELRTYLATRVA